MGCCGQKEILNFSADLKKGKLTGEKVIAKNDLQ